LPRLYFHARPTGISNIPNLIDYIIENRELRYRIIELSIPFSIIGGTMSSICMLLARYYR
jgi:hypothetical protein